MQGAAVAMRNTGIRLGVFCLALAAGLGGSASVGVAEGPTRGEHSPFIVYPAAMFNGLSASVVVNRMRGALSSGNPGLRMGVPTLVRAQTYRAEIEGRSENFAVRMKPTWLICRTVMDVSRGQEGSGASARPIISVDITAISCRKGVVKGKDKPDSYNLYTDDELPADVADTVLSTVATVIARNSGGRVDDRLPTSFNIRRDLSSSRKSLP